MAWLRERGIGDGGIVMRRAPDEPFEVATWPEAGEYVNQTFFVTDDDAAAHPVAHGRRPEGIRAAQQQQ